MSTLRLCHLYPRELNIYADRGNIAVLRQRLQWRGHDLEVVECERGDSLPTDCGVYYLGGGQDRDQVLVAEDLHRTKGDALNGVTADGAVLLAVCGGYQLAGHGYTGVDGTRLPGLSLIDVDTVAGSTRLIGDIVITVEIDGQQQTVVGFENHAGRTHLGAGAQPLGRVVTGHGNNGQDYGEGARQGRMIGTYLHGPLLPKNPWLADHIIRWGFEHMVGTAPDLTPLLDPLEHAAHAVAIARARQPRR